MSDAYAPLQLEAHHHPQAPDFSMPEHTRQDAAELRAMLRELCAALDGSDAPPRGRRWVFQPGELRRPQPLAVVGFRGHRRAEVEPQVVAAVEAAGAALVERMARVPELLSYSCRPLDGADWINLVVLRDDTALRRWHHDPLHRQASVQLTPLYYSSVRLHSGALSQGLHGPLQVTSTRYFGFGEPRPWLAQRFFQPN